MGQKNQLWWDIPASESFLLNKHIYDLSEKKYKETLDELVEYLDVKDKINVQVRRLSLGERMKMEIIASLLHKPKIIMLDEPSLGLDVMSQAKIREFVKYYNEQYNNEYNQYNQYLNQDINAMYSNNYSNNQVKHSNKINNIQTMAHNDNGTNVLYENDNTSNYYDINRTQDKQTNEIDGMYIEPPFM